MDILSQIEVTKMPGILDVFRHFRGEKLRQKIRRFAEKEFLEVPIHLYHCQQQAQAKRTQGAAQQSQ